MRSYNTTAIVLKNLKFKDSDKIYTVFSKEKGKISVIAKGVRKISSKRSGNLDTLNVVEIKLNPHKSGQYYVSEAKTVQSFQKLKTDYELMKVAFYIVELVNRTTKEDEHAHEIFDLLKETLTSLEQNNEDVRVKVNKFEIKFMQLLGYQPPKYLVLKWRDSMRVKDFENANRLIKSFVFEIVGEEIKSLELE